MAACATAVQQADGSFLIALDVTNQNLSTCPYVLESGAEFSTGSLLDLSPEQATQLATAIAALWVAAWCMRALIRTLGSSDHDQDEP